MRMGRFELEPNSSRPTSSRRCATSQPSMTRSPVAEVALFDTEGARVKDELSQPCEVCKAPKRSAVHQHPARANPRYRIPYQED